MDPLEPIAPLPTSRKEIFFKFVILLFIENIVFFVCYNNSGPIEFFWVIMAQNKNWVEKIYPAHVDHRHLSPLPVTDLSLIYIPRPSIGDRPRVIVTKAST